MKRKKFIDRRCVHFHNKHHDTGILSLREEELL